MNTRYCDFMLAAIVLFFMYAAEAYTSNSIVAFQRGRSITTTRGSFRTGGALCSISRDNEDEVYHFDRKGVLMEYGCKNGTTTDFLDDLTPPPVNFARDSILFSDKPATKRNNAAVKFWSMCRTNLPPVFTGTWPWRDPSITERDPMGALYNMFVVRIPTISIGVVYIRNLVEGHPLIMDFGHGPFEMSPLIVFSVLALILA